MMMRLKSLPLAMAALFLANVANAQVPQSHDKWLEQQQKFNKRIEASNRRATRSICADLCKEQRRPTNVEIDELFEPASTSATRYERARTPYEMQLESEGLQDEGELDGAAGPTVP
ncbi:hypothetical protein [Microvirga zambiensis]|uniref:hypothetical protein n=1 Tax=Microvirga zambiensis TaxID=1402137 RepID=UPI00191F0C0D|nr:hypothetical protein [Microvirga zambiensis]